MSTPDERTIAALLKICMADVEFQNGCATAVSFHNKNLTFESYLRHSDHKGKVAWLLSRLPHLEYLNLRKAQLGFCPEINSVNLKYLDLSCNGLEECPNWLHRQHRLEYLNLGANSITGVQHLDHMPIKKLLLHKNRLSLLPRLPGTIEHINVFMNQFGTWPTAVQNLPRLKYLSAGGEPIDDLLPWNSDQMCALEYLLIVATQLERLPDCLCNLSQLKGLVLAKNQLEHLPYEIGNLRNLEHCSLYANHLRWPPPSFFELQFTQLNVARNDWHETARSELVRRYSGAEYFRI